MVLEKPSHTTHDKAEQVKLILYSRVNVHVHACTCTCTCTCICICSLIIIHVHVGTWTCCTCMEFMHVQSLYSMYIHVAAVYACVHVSVTGTGVVC